MNHIKRIKNYLLHSVKSSLSGSIYLVVLAIFLAACSSASPPPTTMTNSQSEKEISQAYDTLFDFQNPSVDKKVAVIQDGTIIKNQIKEALAEPLAREAGGAKVLNVQVYKSKSTCLTEDLSSPCATVTYEILSPSGVSLLGTSSVGYAVLQNGKWVVAKNTICGLLALLAQNGGPSLAC